MSLFPEAGPWIDGPSLAKDTLHAVKCWKFSRLSYFVQVIDDCTIQASKHKIFTASILGHLHIGLRAIAHEICMRGDDSLDSG